MARQATLENRHIADTHEIFSAETAGDQHEHVTAGGVPTRQACPAYCTASRPTPSSAQAQAAALAWLLGGSLSRQAPSRTPPPPLPLKPSYWMCCVMQRRLARHFDMLLLSLVSRV